MFRLIRLKQGFTRELKGISDGQRVERGLAEAVGRTIDVVVAEDRIGWRVLLLDTMNG